MSEANYKKTLRESAARAEPLDEKALSPAQYQNQQNLKKYADRRLRHAIGMPMFHVKRPWWRRVLRRCAG